MVVGEGKGVRRKREGGSEVGNLSWEESEVQECTHRPHILFPPNWCCHWGIFKNGDNRSNPQDSW